MKKVLFTLSSVCLACLLGLTLAACSSVTKEDVGTVVGGVAGGYAGNALTGGNTLGTIGGTLGGAYLGRTVAKDVGN